MHGVILTGLRDFVTEQADRQAWKQLKTEADVDRMRYSRMESYPDDEFLKMYSRLVSAFEGSGERAQHRLGRYLFSTLTETYERIYIDDEWTALELLDNVESIHESLRTRDRKEFAPPELFTERKGDDTLVVRYRSDRQLCGLAKGMIMGVSEYYGTELAVSEPRCMKEGNEVCRLVVERVS